MKLGELLDRIERNAKENGYDPRDAEILVSVDHRMAVEPNVAWITPPAYGSGPRVVLDVTVG